MGALSVALARESFFGENLMKKSSVGGQGLGTAPLPWEGMEEIIFSLCTDFHNDKSRFEKDIWSKCKSVINRACNEISLHMTTMYSLNNYACTCCGIYNTTILCHHHMQPI